MSNEYRGGNSRQLSRVLDLLDKPLAVLDRRGQIVFVNAALCHLAGADATKLVGQRCSWDVAPDESEFAALLTALAPPESAREGRIASRNLEATAQPAWPSAQCFLPLTDEDQTVHATLVIFGQAANGESYPTRAVPGATDREWQTVFERVLVEVRAEWPVLDDLHVLIGSSAAIRLAMQRAQLAIAAETNCIIYGPAGIGKADIARGIFQARLRAAGLAAVAGNFFPVDCRLLDATLMDGMLEVFASRRRPELPAKSQLLVLEHLDELPAEVIRVVLRWLEGPLKDVLKCGLCRQAPKDLQQRGSVWRELLASLGVVVIEVPALCTRREDILPLAQQKLAVACRQEERALLSFSTEVQDLLEAYSWPRNCAELEAAIHEAVKHAVLTKTIQPTHLPVEIRTFRSSLPPPHAEAEEGFPAINLDEILQELERIILARALKLSPRNRAQAARWLDISRPRLLRRIQQLGLDDAPTDRADHDESSEID